MTPEQVLWEIDHRDYASGALAVIEGWQSEILAGSRLATIAEVRRRVMALPHQDCDDSWYSCRLHPDHPADEFVGEPVCTCLKRLFVDILDAMEAEDG